MTSQAEKGRAFRALHEQKQCFFIPNPWDAGSARILEGLGFPALATTSGGFANSTGKLDGQPGREAVLEHAKLLTSATKIPVSADLESGFGDSPKEIAETIRLAAAAGLVGGSIEDYSGKRDEPLYEIPLAADRVRAAAEAAKKLDFPFTLTARAENFFRGKPDLADTIKRLQAYQEAGADVLFAPALRSREDIATVLREIDRPLSVLGGIGGIATLSLADYQALGVRRVSVGSLLSTVAYGALIAAGQELKDQGTFTFTGELARAKDLKTLLQR
ncbi:MAG TPA: isocitrate lyase/phosphoenolpyruvate mutase family protein [Polyangiales bacterium]|nr:isocitrate lyase/phosphoenolpyruvate mutase family protein [Polyangiales bacterium]